MCEALSHQFQIKFPRARGKEARHLDLPLGDKNHYRKRNLCHQQISWRETLGAAHLWDEILAAFTLQAISSSVEDLLLLCSEHSSLCRPAAVLRAPSSRGQLRTTTLCACLSGSQRIYFHFNTSTITQRSTPCSPGPLLSVPYCLWKKLTPRKSTIKATSTRETNSIKRSMSIQPGEQRTSNEALRWAESPGHMQRGYGV